MDEFFFLQYDTHASNKKKVKSERKIIKKIILNKTTTIDRGFCVVD